MKIRIIGPTVLFAILGWCLPPASPAQAMPIDGYAAIVNQRVITVGDVLALTQGAEQRLRDQYAGPELQRKREEIYATGLDELVDQALIIEEFKKQGGTIPDRLVNDRINEVIFDRFHNERAEFLQALADQQMTLDEWREEIRDQIVVGLLRRQEVSDKVKLSPRAVLETYEARLDRYRTPDQIQLRMIVLNTGANADEREAKRQKAIEARGRLLSGDDFRKVAREVSDGSKAEDGGDWGWIEPSILRPELSEAAARLKPGDISDIIEAGDSFYVMLIEERRTASVKSFDEARKEIEDEMKEAEAQRIYKAWIERLKRKHFVQVFEQGKNADL